MARRILGINCKLRQFQNACANGKNEKQTTVMIFWRMPIPNQTMIRFVSAIGAIQVTATIKLESFNDRWLELAFTKAMANSVARPTPANNSTSDTSISNHSVIVLLSINALELVTSN